MEAARNPWGQAVQPPLFTMKGRTKAKHVKHAKRGKQFEITLTLRINKG